MTDRILLRGLRARGFHGVLPEERRDGQEFIVDVELSSDTRAAAASDDLADTVDYAAVAAAVLEVVTGDPVDLIETLAQRIADTCLTFVGVDAVEVTVHKPEAPVGVPFTDVELRIRRP
ncbi:MAG: dihydroneopterin aldolase [Candidatus Nanopelagicales bacterium]